MKRFYLTGHNDFGNRGCEAIVRSTIGILKEKFDDIEVLVPSADIFLDSAQWPDADKNGVHFVPSYQPKLNRYWVHSQRLPIPLLKRAGWPFPLPKVLQKTLADVDAVLSVGGDNYSLDYRLPSLLMGMDKAAMDKGTPVVLWGASVGPFEAEPYFLPAIRQHLARMACITARESVTETYLKENLGLKNVMLVADPAFALKPEAVDIKPFWPSNSDTGVLGLNISPLIKRYRVKGEKKSFLLDEVAEFVRQTVKNLDMSVLLIPHVIPLNGDIKNNDFYYMEDLLARIGDLQGRVRLMAQGLNAAEIKDVISQCRFFIGARTHATIAALSSGVPTVSIAYSVKAIGINNDLFGHTDYVLETLKVSQKTLTNALEQLLSDEALVRELLGQRIPVWKQRAAAGVVRLAEIIR